MKKKSSLLFKIMVLCVVSISLMACSKKEDVRTETSYEYSDSAAPIAPDRGEEAKAEGGIGNSDVENNALANRKIIENKYISMETLEFDDVITQAENLVYEYLGYIEGAEVSGNSLNRSSSYSRRYATYTFRVPSKNFNFFVQELKDLGNVVNERVIKEDVTMQYFDLEARVVSLKVQEERLLEIVAEGAKLTEILEVESKLSQVRYEIETYTATLKNLENQVGYGTVRLELQEVYEETTVEKPAITVGEKISKGFSQSVRNVKDFFVGLFIFLITASPYLVIWGLIIVGIIVLVKKLDARSKKKEAKKGEQKQDKNV